MKTYTNETRMKVPGRKGAIARLIVMGLIALISLLVSFGTLPGYAVKLGLGRAIVEAIAGCGVLFFTAAFFWGLMKWIGVVAPKSFRLANSFWCGWIPLTFFGLYIKCAIWLVLAIAPCSAFVMLFSPLFSGALWLAQGNLNFFTATGVFLGGGLLVALFGFVDVCKVFQFSPIGTVKRLLFAGK